MANLLFNAENVRTLVLLVAVICGIVWQRQSALGLNYKIKELKNEVKSDLSNLKNELLNAMDEKIDIKLSAFHTQLKTNDFVHLNATIEALTFTLERNKYLSPEDKAYVDGRLDK